MIRPQRPAALAGDRGALVRQIEAVDSAIATTSSQRRSSKPRGQTPRTARPARTDATPRPPSARVPQAAPATRASGGRVRSPAPADTQSRDPRQSYWDRSLYFDSVRLALVGSSDNHTQTRSSRAPPSAVRRLPSAAVQPPLDLDVAGSDELAALPLIGTALARRIVADRIENGPFGSITGLERVRGITAALSRRLSPFVTFSRSPRLGSAGERPAQTKKSAPPKGALRP
jgi:competence protein ComEA